MEKRNLVYGLKDPRNDVYFYIGKTTNSIGRPLDHLRNSHNAEVNKLVEEINSKGLTVIITVLEDNINLDNLASREKFWINHYYDINEFLLNKKDVMSERDKILMNLNDIDENILDNLLLGLVDIGTTIRNFRIKRNLNQDELSEITGLNRITISRIENNNYPNLNTIIKILEILKSCKRKVSNHRLVRATSKTFPHSLTEKIP